MIRSALLLCAGLLAVLCFACVAVAPPPPPAAISAGVVTAQGRPPLFRSAACQFDASQVVVELSPDSNAAVYGACAWRPGNCIGQPAKASNPVLPPARMQLIQAAIQDAFDNAPGHLQTELCGLHQIYIDPRPGAQNWGLRDVRTVPKSKEIGLSDAMFPDLAVQPYANFETANVRALLVSPQSPLPPGSAGAIWLGQVSHTAVPDNPTIKTMAILAHETAHVMWWAEQVPDLVCPATGTTFDGIGAWRQPTVNPPGFHGLGASRGNHSAVDDFTLSDMVRDLKQGNTDEVTQEMLEIYQGDNWVNLFSFVDPDEDFIETYKFWVLTHAQGASALTSLSIQFPGSGDPLPIIRNQSFGANPLLLSKRLWIEDYIQAPTPCQFRRAPLRGHW